MMPRTKTVTKIAMLPVAAFVLSLASGCGAPANMDATPEVGAQRKQARIDAYGKSGIPNAKLAPSAVGNQSAARRGGK